MHAPTPTPTLVWTEPAEAYPFHGTLSLGEYQIDNQGGDGGSTLVPP